MAQLPEEKRARSMNESPIVDLPQVLHTGDRFPVAEPTRKNVEPVEHQILAVVDAVGFVVRVVMEQSLQEVDEQALIMRKA